MPTKAEVSIVASLTVDCPLQASGRHQCETLVQLESAAFRAQGGEESWLREGLSAAPVKLSRLSTLNKLLAHRPWLVQRHHIEVRA